MWWKQTHSRTLCRERELRARQMRCRRQIPALGAQGTLQKRKPKKGKCRRKWRTQGNKALQIEMSKAHVNSQRLEQRAQGLSRSAPGFLCSHDGFQISARIGLRCLQTSGSLILLLGSFPSVGLSFPTSMRWFCFIVLYSILLYFIISP